MIIKKELLFVIVLFAALRVPAQLCQGSLGDPIINITFGAGSNPGPALTTTKNLNFKAGDCPNDGFYTVRNNTSQCFGNTWHTLATDHTGDPNGYFMLINASLQKSEFYIDTLSGLCPNTTYEFAAWIMNVIVPSACFGNTIKPNITFNIESTDGTVLKTYTTGNIDASQIPTWIQYGFFFTTPSTTSNIVLRLLNNSTGGCGNDLAIDDITFRPCGPKINPSIKGVSGNLKELCVGDNTTVTFETNLSAGYNNPSFLWQQSKDGGYAWNDIMGETKSTLTRNFTSSTAVGTYLYRVSVSEASNAGSSSCRVASTTLTVRVNRNPVTTISSNSPACQGTTLTLSAVGGGSGYSYDWSGPNSFSANGSSVTIKNVQLNAAGKYLMLAKDTNGCRNADSTMVVIKPAPVITTAFTEKTICGGGSVLLKVAGGISYTWSPAAGLSSATISDPVAMPVDTTVYKVFVQNASSCIDSATVSINVIPKPKVSAGPDKVIVEGQSVQLNGSVVGNNTMIKWSPDLFINNSSVLQPFVNPNNNTNYVLTATSNDGCGISIDTVNVHVYKKIIIPNAFSPNADGINDTWKITALDAYENYELSVFNRFGQIVFSSKNYESPWNGTFNNKPLPVGTYYYLLDLKLALPKLNGFVVILK